MKSIPKEDINPLFLLSIDEQMKKVDEILFELNKITPDIRFFDLDDEFNVFSTKK